MKKSTQARVRLLVSSAIVGVAFVSAPSAMAACTTTTASGTTTIDCATGTAVADVQAAIDALNADVVSGGSTAIVSTNLTLNAATLSDNGLQAITIGALNTGADVSGSNVNGYEELTGAIIVNNTGFRTGTAPALDYNISGVDVASAANTLNFTNSGTMDYAGEDGDLSVFKFGGAVTIANTGSMDDILVENSFSTVAVTNGGGAGDINVDAEGNISVVNTGEAGNIQLVDVSSTNATVPNLTVDNSGVAGSISATTGGTINIANSGESDSITAISVAGGRPATSGEAAAGVLSIPGGNVVVSSTGFANGSIYALSQGGVTQTIVSGSGTTTTTVASGTATVTANDVDGDVTAYAKNGASVTATGEITGSVLANTWGPADVQVVTTASGSSTTNTQTAGVASVATTAGSDIGGSVTATSIGGASADVNGSVDDGLNVYSSSLFSGFAFNTETNSSTSSSSSGGTSVTGSSSSSSVTNAGATAVATIGSEGVVWGNVNVYGDADASLTSAGEIRGDVNVFSSVSNIASGSSTTTTSVSGGSTTTVAVGTMSATAAGGTASFANSGVVFGDTSTVYVVGVDGASLNNSGEIYDNVVIRSLGQNASSSQTLTNVSPASGSATSSWVRSLTANVVGGDASATNSGLIDGEVSLAGATGTFTNTATGVVGSVTVGQAITALNANTYTASLGSTGSVGPQSPLGPLGAGTVTDTENLVEDNLAPVRTFTAAPVFTQVYTINNNGEIGDAGNTAIDIGFNDPSMGVDFATDMATSIKATVNLNNGSTTLGGIYAQQGVDDAFLTDTTVNLNGEGLLGGSTQVLGVNALNKTGSGTFLIDGAPMWDNDDHTHWTLDVGSFNINAGEIQLAVGDGNLMRVALADVTPSEGIFGIHGDVVNNATLVIGTRQDPAPSQFGNSLTTVGQAINGIDVAQTGDFTQSASGKTVVGIAPSVVRIAQLEVSNAGSSNEVLGPINASVSIPYFSTTADALANNQALGMISTPSTWAIDGDLNLAGKLEAVVTRDGIYQNGDGGVVFSYTGAGNVTATASQNLASQFVAFDVKHNATAKTVALTATRKSYATAAANTNAAAAGVALDSTIPVVVSRLTQNAATGNAFASVSELGMTQDMANIISGMDWRVGAAGATAVLNDLSSGEFYGSLSALDQNVLFGDAVKGLAQARKAADGVGTTFWMSPAGNFAKYNRGDAGASDIKATSYGVTGGFDFAYTDDGSFGIGMAYGEHDVNAKGTPEKAKASTITIGAYWTQKFGPLAAEARFAYGFSNFDATRELASLARTATADFKGTQVDASVELGYELKTGSVDVTPFAKLALRRWSFDGFTEEGAQSVALNVAEDNKTVFSPELGVRLAGQVGRFQPYVSASYTFQGDIGSDREMQFIGGGNAFTVQGIDPTGYGTIVAGVNGAVTDKISIFINGRYSFSGGNQVGRIGGGLGIKF